MFKRVLFAILMIAVLLALIFLGGWWLKGAVGVVILTAVYEMYKAFAKGLACKPVCWPGYAFILASLLLSWLYASDGYMMLTTSFILAMLAVCLALAMLVIRGETSANGVLASVLPIIYPGLFLLPMLVFIEKNNMGIILLIIACPVMTDTFALFGGSLFGKKKLAPAISPHKTVAGAAAGLLGGAVAAVALWMLIFMGLLSIDFYLNLLPTLMLGLLCGVFAQLGDLSASLIKRVCGIKDFGSLIPGHGGIMDRIDSILFCVPVVTVFYIVYEAVL